jgi:hypothetical protein
LLCAIRNAATSEGYVSLSDEITQTCLIHPFNTGKQRFRVYPRLRDREDYLAAVEGRDVAAGTIRDGLQFFSSQLSEVQDAETEMGLRTFFGRIVSGLEFVSITLEGENPYGIFRSLNSTGVDLSEADLIRNFVFMHVPADMQDEFDDKRWKPLESRFSNQNGELDVKAFSGFFRDVLMKGGQYVPPASTFEHFEQRHDSPTLDAFKLLDDLEKHAAVYDSIRGAKHDPDPLVEAALTKLRQLDSSTAYPLILNLMEHGDGELTKEDLITSIELVTGFILRRFVCGMSSKGYGRWFVSACKELGLLPLRNLNAFLAGKGFPGDKQFVEQFVKFNFYDSRYCRVGLETLERMHPRGVDGLPHKEQADLSLAQIEHIMPQTLSDQWRLDLGSRAEDIHAEWLNTLGNLTLSAYNPSLYNNPFTDKQKEYEKSNISITRELAQLNKWTDTEIKCRGEKLAGEGTKIWRGPD